MEHKPKFDCSILITARRDSKITQEEFANKMGISKATYALIEYGKIEPTPELIQKISAILDLPAHLFMI